MRCHIYYIDIFENDGNNHDDLKLTLKDILVFGTGGEEEPPCGFTPSACLQFSKFSKFPLSNTCGNTITIPICHETFEQFCYHVRFGILNSPGFTIA